MKICVTGSGYVGLVTGTGFAETGNDVVCADIDADKIERLKRGDVPIYEPGLPEMIARNVEAGRLSFSADVGAAIAGAEIIFIGVGTPPRPDGGANLSAVDKVAEAVAKHAARECILVMKSTVPVGTNARVRRIVEGAKHRVHVVSNPEFLKEGDAVNDFMRPERIVIGCDEDDTFARDIMERLYHPVSLVKNRIIWMSPESAEITKYVSNTMLAMRISFMNEVATLCEQVGADVHEVRQGVGSDGRIGEKFLYAGPGYGGSCFPKDVSALVAMARDHGIEMELAAATGRVNTRHKTFVVRKLRRHFGDDLRGKRIAVWGVAFKPRTDDVRDSPALDLIDTLLAEGAIVSAHDPKALPSIKGTHEGKITFAKDAYSAAKGADALVLMTEWREYQNPDFARLKTEMKQPVLFDGRNIWSEYGLRKQGFHYEGVGVKGS